MKVCLSDNDMKRIMTSIIASGMLSSPNLSIDVPDEDIIHVAVNIAFAIDKEVRKRTV